MANSKNFLNKKWKLSEGGLRFEKPIAKKKLLINRTFVSNVELSLSIFKNSTFSSPSAFIF